MDLDLRIKNRSGQPWIFQGVRGQSNIDIPLTTANLEHVVVGLESGSGITSSDHSVIVFGLTGDVVLVGRVPWMRFSHGHIDKIKLNGCINAELMDVDMNNLSDDGITSRLVLAIVSEYSKVLGTRKMPKRSKPPWWNSEVTASKQAFRREKRSWMEDKNDRRRNVFKQARNGQVHNIRKAKMDAWWQLSLMPLTINSLWGKIATCVIRGRKSDDISSAMRRRDGTYTTDLKGSVDLVLDELIPTSPADSVPVPEGDWVRLAGIGFEYLRSVVWRQRNKVPRTDGLTARIVKASCGSIL